MKFPDTFQMLAFVRQKTSGKWLCILEVFLLRDSVEFALAGIALGVNCME